MANTRTGQPQLDDGLSASVEELFAEIERLTEANRADRDPASERRLLRLRHLAGIRLSHDARPGQHPTPGSDLLPVTEGLPDFAPEDVTAELLRAAILRDGCMVVRGLVDRDAALALAAQIERAFHERERKDSGGQATPGYYELFRPTGEFDHPGRKWIKESGGLLAVDSPILAFEMMELFSAAGVPQLVADYLGEPPLFSMNKTTLRMIEPSDRRAWHQDGSFMGEVRSLNLWLSLSRCGDVAPGLDIVPRRLSSLVETGTAGAIVQHQVSEDKAEEAAGDVPIVRPIFEPGDAVLFDDLFLHTTAADRSMPNTRYAIESWFFGASGFPDSYAPIAV